MEDEQKNVGSDSTCVRLRESARLGTCLPSDGGSGGDKKRERNARAMSLETGARNGQSAVCTATAMPEGGALRHLVSVTRTIVLVLVNQRQDGYQRLNLRSCVTPLLRRCILMLHNKHNGNTSVHAACPWTCPFQRDSKGLGRFHVGQNAPRCCRKGKQ